MRTSGLTYSCLLLCANAFSPMSHRSNKVAGLQALFAAVMLQSDAMTYDVVAPGQRRACHAQTRTCSLQKTKRNGLLRESRVVICSFLVVFRRMISRYCKAFVLGCVASSKRQLSRWFSTTHPRLAISRYRRPWRSAANLATATTDWGNCRRCCSDDIALEGVLGSFQGFLRSRPN